MLSLVGHAVAVNPDGALREEARAGGWEVRDFRTGRKAAKIGVPAAAGLGAVAGGVVGGIALQRRYAAEPLPNRLRRYATGVRTARLVSAALRELPGAASPARESPALWPLPTLRSAR
jgi:hypothetical protein